MTAKIDTKRVNVAKHLKQITKPKRWPTFYFTQFIYYPVCRCQLLTGVYLLFAVRHSHLTYAKLLTQWLCANRQTYLKSFIYHEPRRARFIYGYFDVCRMWLLNGRTEKNTRNKFDQSIKWQHTQTQWNVKRSNWLTALLLNSNAHWPIPVRLIESEDMHVHFWILLINLMHTQFTNYDLRTHLAAITSHHLLSA